MPTSAPRAIRLLPWPNPWRRENPTHLLLCRALEQQGIRIVRIPLPFSLLPYGPRFDWLHLYWTESRYAARDVKAREAQFERFITTLRALKARGVQIIWTMNNEVPHEADDPAFYRRAYQRLMDISDLIHVHFAGAVDYIGREYQADPGKVVVVPIGHFGNHYGEALPQSSARAALGIPADACVLVNIGYLRRYKGIEEAIESFNATTDKRLWFVIAGEPADPEIAAYLAAARRRNPRLVMRLTKLKHGDFAPLLSAADAFVFPSRRFFTSSSIMLGLTYGLPFIAMPHHHTRHFLGRSFFRAWEPADRQTLTAIMDDTRAWLGSVDRAELESIKTEFDWRRVSAELRRRLEPS